MISFYKEVTLMGIGANIKQLLKTQGKTIKWLSVAAEIPVNTLYNITKRDEINVHPKNLEAIAKSLNVSVNELTGSKSVPMPQPAETSKETNTATPDSSDSQAKTNDSPKATHNLSLAKLDLWEFKKSMRVRKMQENSLCNNPALSQEEIDHILKRRHDEEKLLRYFFLLKPDFKKLILDNVERELYFQEECELYQIEYSSPIPSEEELEEWYELEKERMAYETDSELEDIRREAKERGEAVTRSLDEKLKRLDV